MNNFVLLERFSSFRIFRKLVNVHLRNSHQPSKHVFIRLLLASVNCPNAISVFANSGNTVMPFPFVLIALYIFHRLAVLSQ
ncbi:hypothetical protein CW304_28195 [Bacillus sp. UFRGS-B20]|nr:hypothetical protein CW304_28195 [Bacillus sp. UFRGS-B20]